MYPLGVERLPTKGTAMGKWLMMAALLGLLALALWAAYRQWILIDIAVPAWGWGFMVMGVALSVLVGGGLMALIFYSSRMGYDEPPQSSKPEDDGRS
jgi:hypothetical protein